jgi:hypothetical protein
MLKGILIILALGIFTFASSSFQDGEELCSGIAPQNDLWIGVNDKAAKGITRAEFNDIMDRLEKIYKPIFKKVYRRKFKIDRKWEDGTVNAYANQSGKTSMIHMFGGLARYQGMNKIGMAMVACHEIGHHLGGKPKVTRFLFPSWAANEGQSDLYATLKCMRRYLRDDKMDITRFEDQIHPLAQEMCSKTWATNEEVEICELTSIGSQVLANVLNSLAGSSKPVKFDTPDPHVVKKTNDSHPKAQCRLDTYFQGSLCDKDYLENINLKNEKSAQCVRSEGYTVGVRPLCWYKPKN